MNFLAQFLTQIFLLACSFYVLTNLQWYDYKISRVIFRHHRISWHFFYFLVPISVFFFIATFRVEPAVFSLLALNFCYIFALFFWHRSLTHRLRITKRVRIFFITIFVFFAAHLLQFWCFPWSFSLAIYGFFTAFMAFLASFCYEFLIFRHFTRRAKNRLKNGVKIIAITGSFGKTSMKNFIFALLNPEIPARKTPKSVNTKKGIVADVNENLRLDHKIYIAECGARERHDIAEISEILQHQVAVLGEIGKQHIEYFKTIQNVSYAKTQILNSKNLQIIFAHKSHENAEFLRDVKVPVVFFGAAQNIDATLSGTSFSLEISGVQHDFFTQILGDFSVENLSAAILVAQHFGVPISRIKSRVAALKPVPHRLEKIMAGKKMILDDSYNGNLNGMLGAIKLCAQSTRRRVIVTPGIIEAEDSQNVILARKIDEIFDLVIITGERNSKILAQNITRAQKIILKDKKNLTQILKSATFESDLILFANDAPNFI